MIRRFTVTFSCQHNLIVRNVNAQVHDSSDRLNYQALIYSTCHNCSTAAWTDLHQMCRLRQQKIRGGGLTCSKFAITDSKGQEAFMTQDCQQGNQGDDQGCYALQPHRQPLRRCNACTTPFDQAVTKLLPCCYHAVGKL